LGVREERVLCVTSSVDSIKNLRTCMNMKPCAEWPVGPQESPVLSWNSLQHALQGATWFLKALFGYSSLPSYSLWTTQEFPWASVISEGLL
jgi:hypothetical protein